MDAETLSRVERLSPRSPTDLRTTGHGLVQTTANSLLYKLERPVYSSPRSPPPQASNNPENNICKMIEYRGAKVAAFNVDGRELICLPQAFDLFLKHLVGGLHTVYTKLKRLEITPIVCNVEQVRILRGLGAIQPGVNRCKLIAPKEFDVLYEDCTNSSARPGRPPKRTSSLSASPDALQKLKKTRLDHSDYGLFSPDHHHHHPLEEKKSPLLANGYNHYPHHLAMLPFMHLGHPMAYPAVSMAVANHYPFRTTEVLSREHTGSESDVLSPRSKEDRPDNVSHHSEERLSVSSPIEKDRRHSSTDKESGIGTPSDHAYNGPQQLDLSKTGPHASNHSNGSGDDEDDLSDGDNTDDIMVSPNHEETSNKLPEQGSTLTTTQLLGNDTSGISSIETLLVNIQGLLKVAAENARHRERQISMEKAELRMEILRERELRESTEKQLQEEQRNRVLFQKKWKKEKKARRRLQEQADDTSKHADDSLRGQERDSADYSSDPDQPEHEERKLQNNNGRIPSIMDSYVSHPAVVTSNGFIPTRTPPHIVSTESG